MGAIRDLRGYPMSGASGRARDAWDRALGALVTWRARWRPALDEALADAPGFVMAHVLAGYASVGSRDPAGVPAAVRNLSAAAALPATDRERLHLAALRALAVEDDPDRARAAFAQLLAAYPRDLLALHAAHALDYRVGALGVGPDRAELVLDRWAPDMAGFGTVLAIHAFEREERGEYALAADFALRALDADPADARAIHAMAHVFEMTERPAEGVRWLGTRAVHWAGETLVAHHCWWHLALLHLAQGGVDQALSLYDRRLQPGPDAEIADLIDAAALLWRIDLEGGDCGMRWSTLASRWAPHIADAYCSFSDVHAMLAFVGAGDWALAARLEHELERVQERPTRHGETTRSIGLPACRAIVAFGQRRDADAVRLLAGLPALAYRLGGSHAQRDILALTLLASAGRMRRAWRRPRLAA